MTISNVNQNTISTMGAHRVPAEQKLSPRDAEGMRGNWARTTTDGFHPTADYKRHAGALRLKRGDTSLKTIKKTYGDRLPATMQELPNQVRLDQLRKATGETDIDGIIKYFRCHGEVPKTLTQLD